MTIYVLVTPKNDLDRAVYSIKNGDGWKLIKEGWKYLEFEREGIKVRVEKNEFENFNINNINWKLRITEIEEFMNSTYIYYVGKKENCMKQIRKLKNEYKNIEIKI